MMMRSNGSRNPWFALWAVAGALLPGGCGSSGGGYFTPSGDLARPADLGVVAGIDLAMRPPVDFAAPPGPEDLAMPAPRDLAQMQGAGATGDPCAQAADCAKGLGPNQSPQCLKSSMLGNGMTLTWPAGYCTSPCRTTRTDPNTGLNPDCPGGTATCLGSGATGQCTTACGTSADCRQMYSCFVANAYSLGCLPSALSECNPKQAGSCKPVNGMAQTCVNTGDGTVGSCVPQCNPFNNTGCPGGNQVDCHASDQTGEGLCTSANMNGAVAGSACGNFYSDCPGGYGCLSGKCWRYCNSGNVAQQCSQGATCQKLSMNTPVPVNVAGICSKSP